MVELRTDLRLEVQAFLLQELNHTTAPRRRIPQGERGDNGEIVLWSADATQLRSTFNNRYLKAQNMVCLPHQPAWHLHTLVLVHQCAVK